MLKKVKIYVLPVTVLLLLSCVTKRESGIIREFLMRKESRQEMKEISSWFLGFEYDHSEVEILYTDKDFTEKKVIYNKIPDLELELRDRVLHLLTSRYNLPVDGKKGEGKGRITLHLTLVSSETAGSSYYFVRIFFYDLKGERIHEAAVDSHGPFSLFNEVCESVGAAISDSLMTPF